jgi:hypothetical protein
MPTRRGPTQYDPYRERWRKYPHRKSELLTMAGCDPRLASRPWSKLPQSVRYKVARIFEWLDKEGFDKPAGIRTS